MAPIQGKPSILYTAALERSLGAMLAQCNDEGKKMPCIISAGQWWVQKQITHPWKKFALHWFFPFKNYDTTSYPIRSF